MGFFKSLGKALNPIEQFKNPKKALASGVSMFLDPAGSIVRGGKTGDLSPHSVKGLYDPGGLIGGKPQPAPNSYAPQPAMTLSPGAQRMYDEMKARSAARAAGTTYNPTPAAAPQLAHRVPIQPGMQAQPSQAPYDPGAGPQMLADGGMVEQEYDGDYWENKSFERKPNGKPY